MKKELGVKRSLIYLEFLVLVDFNIPIRVMGTNSWRVVVCNIGSVWVYVGVGSSYIVRHPGVRLNSAILAGSPSSGTPTR